MGLALANPSDSQLFNFVQQTKLFIAKRKKYVFSYVLYQKNFICGSKQNQYFPIYVHIT